jgi:alpha-L-fucosidase 2
MKQTHEGYPQIKAEHIHDYQGLYGRFNISLGESSPEQRKLPTAARMTSISNTTFDPELVGLYLQFGRYLLIASSREGSLPANLQGIWNDNFDPMWGSKFTVNINLQMNYWHSHTTGLGELNSPLWPLLRDMHDQGSRVAREMYNCSGTVTHHNTDLWGDSAPQDNYAASLNWNMGGVWMSLHIYEYYKYTGDRDFLVANYDIIRANAQFMLDYLTPYESYMVTNPSSSPENSYYDPITNSTVAITLGPTMDNALLWELFGVVAEADVVLGGTDQAFVQNCPEMRNQLPPFRINQYDVLAEWIHDFDEVSSPSHPPT